MTLNDPVSGESAGDSIPASLDSAGDGVGDVAHGESVEALSDAAARLRESVQRVIVGKDEAIDLALGALLCRGHVLLEDVPGIGKTTLAKALADSLACDFKRIQFTPDLMPGDVLGVNILNMGSGEFDFKPGPIFSISIETTSPPCSVKSGGGMIPVPVRTVVPSGTGLWRCSQSAR